LLIDLLSRQKENSIVSTLSLPVPAYTQPVPPSRSARLGKVRAVAGPLEAVAAILLILAFAAIAIYQSSQPHDDQPAPLPAVVQPGDASPSPEAATFDASTLGVTWDWALPSDRDMFDLYLRVAASPSGEVYAVDTANSEFHVLDDAGTEVAVWGAPGREPGGFLFGNPNNGWIGGDVDFDAEGNIYVFDSVNDRIQKFSPDREFILEWPITGSESVEFNFPLGAVDRTSERVYVVTQAYPQVLVFDLDGNPITSWGSFGGGEGQFRAPSDVAVAPDGTIWISDKTIARIQHFDPDGNFLGMLGGERGGEPGQFNQVTGLAIDAAYNIFVADFGNGRVQVIRPDGSVIGVITEVPGAGMIAGPFTLWVAPNGVLYVADAHDDRILKLQLPQGLSWFRTGLAGRSHQ
jgi:sugar lactone lactonase YvrE